MLWPSAVGLGDHDFQSVGDRGEFGSRGRLCGLVGRFEREFGLLGAEVVEARLEAGQSFLAAFSRSLPCSKAS
jgi:hypothetical protein